MTIYQKAKISTCHIAGAVAQVVLEDIRINDSNLHSVPEVHIEIMDDSTFAVSLSVHTRTGGIAVETFSLTRDEAFKAAQQFKKNADDQNSLMERVQEAVSQLERKFSDAR